MNGCRDQLGRQERVCIAGMSCNNHIRYYRTGNREERANRNWEQRSPKLARKRLRIKLRDAGTTRLRLGAVDVRVGARRHPIEVVKKARVVAARLRVREIARKVTIESPERLNLPGCEAAYTASFGALQKRCEALPCAGAPFAE